MSCCLLFLTFMWPSSCVSAGVVNSQGDRVRPASQRGQVHDWSTKELLSYCQGSGRSWLPEACDANELDLWECVSHALPVADSVPGVAGVLGGSEDWFCGKMSQSWYRDHIASVDHEDCRVRRDWSLKASELGKGPNRFAKQWYEFMNASAYSCPCDLPYSPDCGWGTNVSTNAEVERQRALCLFYCELLRCYEIGSCDKQTNSACPLIL